MHKIFFNVIKQPSLVVKFASYFTKLRFGQLRIIRSLLSKFDFDSTEDRTRRLKIGLRLRTPKRSPKSRLRPTLMQNTISQSSGRIIKRV